MCIHDLCTTNHALAITSDPFPSLSPVIPQGCPGDPAGIPQGSPWNPRFLPCTENLVIPNASLADPWGIPGDPLRITRTSPGMPG